MQRDKAFILDMLEAAKLAYNLCWEKTKNEWVQAVNEHGGFGNWNQAVSRNPADVKMIIEDNL